MTGLGNPLHIGMILVVLPLVFGARRLPEMGKSMGEGLRGFKGALNGDPERTHALSESPPAPALDGTAERVPGRGAA